MKRPLGISLSLSSSVHFLPIGMVKGFVIYYPSVM